MIKIINPVQKIPLEGKCFKCNTSFTYEINDLKPFTDNFWAPKGPSKIIYYIDCPNCNEKCKLHTEESKNKIQPNRNLNG